MNTKSSLDKLVDMVFLKTPKPPCTYNISLPNNNYTVSMFQLLMALLICGAKKLYGKNITPSDISKSQFQNLECYIKSVGYTIKYNFNNSEPNCQQEKINIWFEQYIPPINCHGINVIY